MHFHKNCEFLTIKQIIQNLILIEQNYGLAKGPHEPHGPTESDVD